MCGRYIPNTEDEIMEIREILSEISIQLSKIEYDDLLLNGDIYPTHITPIIMLEEGKPVIRKVKWGFKKWDGKGEIINAKSETINQSRFFSPYINQFRCIIPAHGYYEWKKLADKSKIKYEFIKDNGGSIFMAGLYRVTPESNEFVILTKEADENINIIHDRMPLMLKDNQLFSWLNGDEKIENIFKKCAYQIKFKEVI